MQCCQIESKQIFVGPADSKLNSKLHVLHMHKNNVRRELRQQLFLQQILHSNVVGIKTIMGYPSKADMSVRSDGCSFLCVHIESKAVGRSENPEGGGGEH